EDLRPSTVLSRQSFENALSVAMALGCSTNAIIHLIALSRRAGFALTLDDFDAAGRRIPVLANIRPSGERYLMEDFFYAGGLRALMVQMETFLYGSAKTVSGRTLQEEIAGAEVYLNDVIRGLDNPVSTKPAMAVLRGNLAPDGAVIKPSAADRRLLKHSGPALVFDSYAEMKDRIDDPSLGATPDTVLVMRGAGPQGGPGMPEWGMLPIPKYLLERGVRDMVRISDARMSGTSYGACILHVAPEAHVGGPLALVQTGDRIAVDVSQGLLQVELSDAELTRRRALWQLPQAKFGRGYGWAYAAHVQQANLGCDFDFLETGFGAAVPEPDIL
uniref:dihydroxy-acid dehydratase domain-containing protein n=1 Tax=Roseibium sp. TaxID=1936156 RepID=UPI003D103372